MSPNISLPIAIARKWVEYFRSSDDGHMAMPCYSARHFVIKQDGLLSPHGFVIKQAVVPSNR